MLRAILTRTVLGGVLAFTASAAMAADSAGPTRNQAALGMAGYATQACAKATPAPGAIRVQCGMAPGASKLISGDNKADLIGLAGVVGIVGTGIYLAVRDHHHHNPGAPASP